MKKRTTQRRKQLPSVYARYGGRTTKKLIAQIFFPLDGRVLDAQDKHVLDQVIAAYKGYALKHHLQKAPMTLTAIGRADSRGTRKYNHWLGMKRAKAVTRYLDRALKVWKVYSSASLSTGEAEVTGRHGFDRRVDLVASYIPKRPPVRLKPQRVKGKLPPNWSQEFEFRTIIGAGVTFGPIGAQVLTIEIRNVKTKNSSYFTYTGSGTGAGIGITRPTGWEKKKVGVWLDLEDFEGPGKVIVFSAGVHAKCALSFFGPKERGRCSDHVTVTFSGWDLNVGAQVDAVGHWHKR